MTVTQPELDELDRKIIDALRADGRTSNRELARQFGVSEGTIRARLKHLIDHGYMRVMAITDVRRAGYQIGAIIGIRVDIGLLNEVTEKLASFEEVQYVAITSGTYDVIVSALFRTVDDLLDFITNRLARIPGVHGTETSYALRVVKQTPFWALLDSLPGHDGSATSG